MTCKKKGKKFVAEKWDRRVWGELDRTRVSREKAKDRSEIRLGDTPRK